MSALQKLEALLAKIQARASEPRVRAQKLEAPVKTVPRAIPTTVPFEMAAAVVAPPVVAAPIEELAPIAVVEEPIDAPIEISFAEPEVGGILVQQDFDDALPGEAVSGEFEVAASIAPEEAPLEEEMLELEELGPADELEPGETVVESVAMDAPLLGREEERAERISQPPESGRELVAAPHESARMAVAAPATPDPNALELEEVHEPPPASSRNLRASPSAPSNSDIVELAPPPRRIEPDEAPVTYAPHTEPPPPPVEAKLASEPPPPPVEAKLESVPPPPFSEPPPAKLSEPPTLAFARIVPEEEAKIASIPPLELEPIAEKASEPPPTRIATGSEPPPVVEAKLATEPPPPVVEEKPASEPPPPVVEAKLATEPPPPVVEEAKLATEPPPPVVEEKLATEPPPPAPVVEEKLASEPPPRAITEPPSAPLEPIRAAVAVQLSPIARAVEHVVVAIDADVIRPEITPSEVAAFVSAVRAPRPASFGALLDAALDL